MAGPVTITCPSCGRAFPVPTEVLGTDGHEVIVRMDRSELYGHLAACDGTTPEPEAEGSRVPAKPTSTADLPRGTVLMPPFIAKGKRPCTLCGAHAEACLTDLHDNPGHTSACCGGCANGNTHPARHESVPCARWPDHVPA